MRVGKTVYRDEFANAGQRVVLALLLFLWLTPPTHAKRAVPASTALLDAGSAAEATVVPGPQQEPFDIAGEGQLFGLINQERSNHGLPPLTVDTRLTQAARKHTTLMVEHSALSHQFEGEPSMQTRFSDEGLPSEREGENLDFDEDIESAHQALMHSPPHRRNILDPSYNVVGVGVMRKGRNLYVTEDFARRLPMYSEPETEAVLQDAIDKAAKSQGLSAPLRKLQPQLRQMACNLALNDALDNLGSAKLPGVSEVLVWTAGDPAKIPEGVEKRLARRLPSGYSLGACFAPSVSHPGGVYWVIMVTY